MKINELFPLAAVGIAVSLGGAGTALAQTFTVAPTPVYGSATAQATTRFRGPGLPGGEAQQAVSVDSRRPIFTVAGYQGAVFAPVAPPYSSASAYTTFAGQPERGAEVLTTRSIDGAQ
jgi:hypothetical protein